MILNNNNNNSVSNAQASALWVNDVRRISDTEPCPCGSALPFESCHRALPQEGHTPSNTLHLHFSAVLIPAEGCESCGSPPTRIVIPHEGTERAIPCSVCSLCRCERCLPLPKRWAVQTVKMSGDVPPETIVQNIRGRLASPPIQQTIQRTLAWQSRPGLAEEAPRGL